MMITAVALAIEYNDTGIPSRSERTLMQIMNSSSVDTTSNTGRPSNCEHGPQEALTGSHPEHQT